MDSKPGIKSTEFWMAVVTAITGIVLIFKGNAEAGAAMVATATAAYGISRGITKKS